MIHFLRFFISFSLLCACTIEIKAFAEENFLLINGKSDEILLEIGPHVNERVTPCSTFKIALSLMGFDSGILQNEDRPVWLFQEGYDDFLESWKKPQTPRSWMKYSCVWFSKVLTEQLGMQKFECYLAALDYGNRDASGGLANAWLTSSLKISPREQVVFVQKTIQEKHPISAKAIHLTKQLLYLEELSNGWRLFGKRGWGGSTKKFDGENEIAWYVGWIEKDGNFFPFAYNIRENKINLSQIIPRVKQLIGESGVF